MLHPYAMVTGVFDEPLEAYKGPTGCCIMSQEFYETDPRAASCAATRSRSCGSVGPVLTAVSGIPSGRVPFGAEHHRAFGELFDRTCGMVAICEDLPEPTNTVTLDPDLKDADGIPAPKLTYRLSDNSRRMLDHAVARGEEVLGAAGARATFSEAPLPMAGWHLMGTARMGTDPKQSVVNEWGRCHDVRNLFIVDGSLFVTAAGVNPTNTIQALALYVADAMKKNLATLFD
jgi:choline dehydrogenase-like flavoprotein